MKRLFILAVVGLLLGGTALFADESVLIDFTKLGADQTVGQNKNPTENGATMIDYSTVAGASFSDADKALMKSSLALNNWQVVLASSARSIANQSVTMTKEAVTNANAKQFNGEDMANKKILGVRIHFPTEPFNSWAIIEPPFDIPAYADKDSLQNGKLVVADADKGKGEKFNGYGVVKNVGVLKSLSITVYGSNFPNGLGVVLEDQDGNQQTVFMDYLEFDGWRTLTWNNPNYVSDVRNRELRKFPLYPKGEPFLKLIGIIVYRDAAQEGGDFVTYIKDMKVTYDKAILDTTRDINDESIWGILQQRAEARRLAELKRLGNVQVLRFIEQQKMDQTPAAPAQ
ncbi:MAG TPA: flagellar filament outer layer protein FlaA [Spirochaetia bacterium]|nr:flagellar filament outer layer protein FlaA [Spirochaetia bacterium]